MSLNAPICHVFTRSATYNIWPKRFLILIFSPVIPSQVGSNYFACKTFPKLYVSIKKFIFNSSIGNFFKKNSSLTNKKTFIFALLHSPFSLLRWDAPKVLRFKIAQNWWILHESVSFREESLLNFRKTSVPCELFLKILLRDFMNIIKVHSLGVIKNKMSAWIKGCMKEVLMIRVLYVFQPPRFVESNSIFFEALKFHKTLRKIPKEESFVGFAGFLDLLFLRITFHYSYYFYRLCSNCIVCNFT